MKRENIAGKLEMDISPSEETRISVSDNSAATEIAKKKTDKSVHDDHSTNIFNGLDAKEIIQSLQNKVSDLVAENRVLTKQLNEALTPKENWEEKQLHVPSVDKYKLQRIELDLMKIGLKVDVYRDDSEIGQGVDLLVRFSDLSTYDEAIKYVNNRGWHYDSYEDYLKEQGEKDIWA